MNEMFDSEIFGEYARIALEKGLVKEAQDAPKKPNPRYDSLDLEAIEMLYGVKPNGDEDHIVEQAHPDPVVVAPAYDRVNGLVENQLERQDIMVGIALKPNDGKLVQRRYVVAHDELLNELLKTAFMLDKKGEEGLMKLADSCSDRLVKEAAWPAAVVLWAPRIWAVVKWVGTALAVSSVMNNHVNLSQGLVNDLERVLTQMGESDLNPSLEKLYDDLEELKGTAERASVYRQGLSDVLAEAEDGVTRDSAVVSTGQFDDELLEFFEGYLKQCKRSRKLVRKGIRDAKRLAKEETGPSTGGLMEFVDPIRQIYRIFEPTERGDVVKALERLVDRVGREGSLDVEIKEAIPADIVEVKKLSAKNKQVSDIMSGKKTLKGKKSESEEEELTEKLMS